MDQRPPRVPANDAAREAAKQDLSERIGQRRRAALIVNTKSRKGAATYREAKQRLEQRGLTIASAYPVRDPSRMSQVVAQCVREGHELVIVGGGDGSISAVMDYFANRKVAFALLPLGTANSFARTLGIPLDLAGAVDVIVSGKLVDIDLGRIDGRHFANAAAIGLQPAIARAVPHGLKRILGRAGYLVVAAGMLTKMQAFACIVTFPDGTSRTFPEAMEVRIANGPYKGGMLAAEDASVESGDLVIHVVQGRSPALLAKIWGQLAARVTPSPEELVQLRAPRFTIATDPVHYVSIDGEAVAHTPITVDVARQALRIMVPADRSELS